MAGQEESHIVSSMEEPLQVVNRQSLCMEALIRGDVDSFVDFFYLTHTEHGSNYTQPELLFLQEKLTSAEEANRAGDVDAVFEAYQELADYFRNEESGGVSPLEQKMDPSMQQLHHNQPQQSQETQQQSDTANAVRTKPVSTSSFKTAVYFYEKCLDLAELNDNLQYRAIANLKLGLAHAAMDDSQMQAAIHFHEEHLRLAQLIQEASPGPEADSMVENAYRHMAFVFQRAAEIAEKSGDHRGAVEAYTKCQDVARQAGDVQHEGLATYRLGLAYGRVDKTREAIECHQRYLHICRETKDQLKEGVACAALADEYQKTGQDDTAVKYLESYLELARDKKQSRAIVEACTSLGNIYSAKGNHKQAVKFLQQAFDEAMKLGDRAVIDAVRVNLGMARGNVSLGKFMTVVNNDLDKLLDWKAQRTSFK